jgi:hypothetical protein
MADEQSPACHTDSNSRQQQQKQEQQAISQPLTVDKQQQATLMADEQSPACYTNININSRQSVGFRRSP